MFCRKIIVKNIKTSQFLAVLLGCNLLLNVSLWQQAGGAENFQIDGYYLGATPEQLGVAVEADPLLEEKYYEVEAGGVRLFFIRVKERLHVYRIVKETGATKGNMTTLLDSLKQKHGTPDRQQIKTSSIRPQNQLKYRTTVQHRAIWNISESQEFIVEMESKRIVYELIDHNPEAIKIIRESDIPENEGFTIEGWKPDF